MKTKKLAELGVPQGSPMGVAIQTVIRLRQEGVDKKEVPVLIRRAAKDPNKFKDDPQVGTLSRAIIDHWKNQPIFIEREEPAKYKNWCKGELENEAIKQMENACRLPVAVAGALMPDCLADNTEVLTPTGFKFICDIADSEMIACVNPENQSVHFANITHKICRPLRSGERVYKFLMGKSNKEIIATERHRMAYVPNLGQCAQEIPQVSVLSDHTMFLNYHNQQNIINLTDDEICFIGWIVGDGNIKITNNKRSKNKRIRFGVKKNRKYKRIKFLLDSIGLTYTEYFDARRGYCITLSTADSKKYLEIVGDNKNYPISWITDMSKEQAIMFLEECVCIDGNYEAYKNTNRLTFNTSRDTDMDFLTSLILLHYGIVDVTSRQRRGYCGEDSSKLMYIIRALKQQQFFNNPSGYDSSSVIKREIEYNKSVVCVTCPTGYFVARQNGYCFVTGNCHLGYGLPIGGVLAVKNAVIPYAVGVDIACRMKMSILDIPVKDLDRKEHLLKSAIDRETRFGIGAKFSNRDKRSHPVLDDPRWDTTKAIRYLHDKAWSQLGTSGSGNHFTEFGILELKENDLGLEKGRYVALLSHSGSRGVGAQIAGHYSRLAMDLHPELPKELKHLSWLSLDDEEGQEYWNAMQLMGEYAAANHACIHKHIAKNLGVKVLLDIENHHNFAWKEVHNGEEVVVHRKGATPAGKGVLGIIPGSMGDPGFVVRGKGDNTSLHSASHGAGRRMSRKKAKESFRWKEVNQYLKERNVKLLSAGLDEVPMAYKDIHEVMAQQTDLVEVVARFDPRLVKMAPAGERPED